MNISIKQAVLASFTAATLTAGAVSWAWSTALNAEPADAPQLAHMVFFKVQDGDPDAKDKLVAACEKYLSGHSGTVYFSVGTRVEELDREVNDLDFDVALHLVFENMAAHDLYQDHPRHQEFIDKNQELWSGVRVFDSFLTTAQP